MGKRSKNNKQTMAASNFKLSISQSTVMGQAAPTKAGVVFVVDRSASMTWNGELDAALNGAKTVTDQVVTENDVVTFWSFSNDLKLHFKAQPKSRIDWGRVETEINTDNGGTRLYDSIIEVVDGLPKRKNYIWDVVILTDGANGGGVHTADSVKAKLSNPGVANFNAILLGVGLSSSTEAIMRDMCAGDNCTYLPVGASASAIADAFHTVTAQVQQHRIKFTAEVSGVGVDGMGGMDLSNLFQGLSLGNGGQRPRKRKQQKQKQKALGAPPSSSASTGGKWVCAFFNTAKGCKNGVNCTFLHVPQANNRKKPSNRKKTKRVTTCFNCGLKTNGPDAHPTKSCPHRSSKTPKGGYACRVCTAVDTHWSSTCPHA